MREAVFTGVRRAAAAIYLALILLTASTALQAALAAPIAWPRLATGCALLAVCVAYLVLYWRRGFSLLAVLAFALSAVLAGYVVDVNTRAIARLQEFELSDVALHVVQVAAATAVIAVKVRWLWVRSRMWRA